MKFLLLVIIGFSLLIGCQNKKTEKPVVATIPSREFVGPPFAKVSSSKKIEGVQAYLTKDAQWSLPSADIIKGSFSAVQSVSGHYGDQKFNIVVQLEKVRDELRLVGLSSLGYQLFQIEYKGGTVSSELSFLVREKIRPANLISDFLLTFGDEDELRLALNNTNFKVEHTSGKRRVLRLTGEPILTINYGASKKAPAVWPEIVNFHHDTLLYDLEIKTLSREPL